MLSWEKENYHHYDFVDIYIHFFFDDVAVA